MQVSFAHTNAQLTDWMFTLPPTRRSGGPPLPADDDTSWWNKTAEQFAAVTTVEEVMGFLKWMPHGYDAIQEVLNADKVIARHHSADWEWFLWLREKATVLLSGRAASSAATLGMRAGACA